RIDFISLYFSGDGRAMALNEGMNTCKNYDSFALLCLLPCEFLTAGDEGISDGIRDLVIIDGFGCALHCLSSGDCCISDCLADLGFLDGMCGILNCRSGVNGSLRHGLTHSAVLDCSSCIRYALSYDGGRVAHSLPHGLAHAGVSYGVVGPRGSVRNGAPSRNGCISNGRSSASDRLAYSRVRDGSTEVAGGLRNAVPEASIDRDNDDSEDEKGDTNHCEMVRDDYSVVL
ncbi:hypothetical protein PMAYCL1PPCAC_30761, partial [Pristionchus mayeri]